MFYICYNSTGTLRIHACDKLDFEKFVLIHKYKNKLHENISNNLVPKKLSRKFEL